MVRSLCAPVVMAVGTALRLRHVRSGTDQGQLGVGALPGGPHGPGQVQLGSQQQQQLRALEPLLVVGDVGGLQQHQPRSLYAVTRHGAVEVRAG